MELLDRLALPHRIKRDLSLSLTEEALYPYPYIVAGSHHTVKTIGATLDRDMTWVGYSRALHRPDRLLQYQHLCICKDSSDCRCYGW